LRIAVIDGQGGGIGRVITERLVRALGSKVEILALGTNAQATAVMMKAGANEGASGEGAVLYNADRVDLIVGPLGVLCAHAFLGEMTPAMAAAVAGSRARKILLPLNRSNVDLVGVVDEPLPHLVDKLVEKVRGWLEAGRK